MVNRIERKRVPERQRKMFVKAIEDQTTAFLDPKATYTLSGQSLIVQHKHYSFIFSTKDSRDGDTFVEVTHHA